MKKKLISPVTKVKHSINTKIHLLPIKLVTKNYTYQY